LSFDVWNKVIFHLFILTRSLKFLSNAISIGFFLSRDIVALGNMRASKLHCSAILPKNIARVNQPLPWIQNWFAIDIYKQPQKS
jgi:hypothetical protein